MKLKSNSQHSTTVPPSSLCHHTKSLSTLSTQTSISSYSSLLTTSSLKHSLLWNSKFSQAIYSQAINPRLATGSDGATFGIGSIWSMGPSGSQGPDFKLGPTGEYDLQSIYSFVFLQPNQTSKLESKQTIHKTKW